MDSFAFAYQIHDHKNQDPSKSNTSIGVAECHLNIWKVNVGIPFSKKKLYFDIGLKIDPQIEWIYAYIPFDIVNNGMDFDLVKRLQNNNKLLCTVFNCDYKTSMGQGDTFGKVTNKKDKVQFYLHQLGSTKFDIKAFYQTQKPQKVIGNLLKIHIQDAFDKDAKIYIRFRIEPKNIEDVVISENISNDFLQSAFSEIDMYDFRINETRNINTDVMDKISGDNFTIFQFDKVHLFYMADTKECVSNGSSLKQDSRLLEKDVWCTYLPDNCQKKNYIAHHWKKRIETTKMSFKENKIDTNIEYEIFNDYRIFFTSVYPKIQTTRLLVYLLVAILIGWSGSMLSFSTNIQNDSMLKIFIIGVMVGIITLFFLHNTYRFIIKIIKK